MLFTTKPVLLALLGTVSLVPSLTEALPTRGSTSTLSRRARIARHVPRSPFPSPDDDKFELEATNPTTGKKHKITINGANALADGGNTINVNFNGREKEKRSTPEIADAAALAPASTPSSSNTTTTGAGRGGIKSSTINLTVISKRFTESVIRSLFGLYGAGGESSAPIVVERVRVKREAKPEDFGLANRDLVRKLAPRAKPSTVAPSWASSYSSNGHHNVNATGFPSSNFTANVTRSIDSRLPPPSATAIPTSSFLNNTNSTLSPTITLTVTFVPGPSGKYVDQADLPPFNSTTQFIGNGTSVLPSDLPVPTPTGIPQEHNISTKETVPTPTSTWTVVVVTTATVSPSSVVVVPTTTLSSSSDESAVPTTPPASSSTTATILPRSPLVNDDDLNHHLPIPRAARSIPLSNTRMTRRTIDRRIDASQNIRITVRGEDGSESVELVDREEFEELKRGFDEDEE
ncbi:hypothetical protein T439DRAFT_349929 [Meredithblackwellia eburnea MCA 4105]